MVQTAIGRIRAMSEGAKMGGKGEGGRLRNLDADIRTLVDAGCPQDEIYKAMNTALYRGSRVITECGCGAPLTTELTETGDAKVSHYDQTGKFQEAIIIPARVFGTPEASLQLHRFIARRHRGPQTSPDAPGAAGHSNGTQ